MVVLFGRNNKRTLDRFARHRTCPGIEPGLIPHRHNPKLQNSSGTIVCGQTDSQKWFARTKLKEYQKNSPRQKWFALLDMIGHSSPVSTSNKWFGSFGLTCPLCVRLQNHLAAASYATFSRKGIITRTDGHKHEKPAPAYTSMQVQACFCLSAKGIF